MSKFTKDIKCTLSPKTGWATRQISLPNLGYKISDIKMGYYHSRLIFQFALPSPPDDIFGLRGMRFDIEKEIIGFLKREIIPFMKSYTKEPRIFIYPIFELGSAGTFWKFPEEKPFSFPSTCFYTELDDPKGKKPEWLVSSLRPKKVHMRVSGAKIVASEMSKWFFWNLINIVFHEGLYRQSREKGRFKGEGVYPGLENRLEDFASSLMKTFYEFSSARVQDLIAKFVLILTILGVLIAIVQFIIPRFLKI